MVNEPDKSDEKRRKEPLATVRNSGAAQLLSMMQTYQLSALAISDLSVMFAVIAS